jgi:hypothetical protein
MLVARMHVVRPFKAEDIVVDYGVGPGITSSISGA